MPVLSEDRVVKYGYPNDIDIVNSVLQIRGMERVMSRNCTRMVSDTVGYDAHGRGIERGHGFVVRNRIAYRDIPGHPGADAP